MSLSNDLQAIKDVTKWAAIAVVLVSVFMWLAGLLNEVYGGWGIFGLWACGTYLSMCWVRSKHLKEIAKIEKEIAEIEKLRKECINERERIHWSYTAETAPKPWESST